MRVAQRIHFNARHPIVPQEGPPELKKENAFARFVPFRAKNS